MEQNEVERLARRFHDVYEQLAPQFGWKTQEKSAVAWSDLPDENRKLMTATVGVVLHELEREKTDAQQMEFDRNHWQRKVGILLALIDKHGNEQLADTARKTVNTNWHTGSQGDPVADIAKMTVDRTLQTAVDAGLVERVTNGAG